MSSRKIIVEQSASDNIASIAWYIESKEMVATVEKLANAVYDYIVNLADNIKSYSICKAPGQAILGYKCISYKKILHSDPSKSRFCFLVKKFQ